MKKRIISIVLSVVVLSSMVLGCGTKSSTTAEAATSTVNEVTACEEATADVSYDYEETYEEAYAPSEPAYDSERDFVSQDTKNLMAEECVADDWYDLDDAYYEEDRYYGDEKYSEIEENDYTSVAVNPLSTFAADVDTASYSNVRRMIMDGYGLYNIPADAVRTEEMVNYFKYKYKEPDAGDIFNVSAQISKCPWNKAAKLMTVGINTATLDSEDVKDCNIVFLVDVSGSMQSSNKLPLIQKSMALLVDNFDAKDRISIVTYASGVETILDGCKGSDSRKIIKAFESLKAGGSTNGGDGIKLAYKLAEKNYIENGVNRVVVCSDGDFNVGLTTQDELEKLISKKKDSGVFLSTLGFGMGNYSDTTMETLADKGNGNYAYIDDLTEAKRVLVDEMTSTFVTVAKDVKLQVEFNPSVVSEYRLVGYENRAMAARDFRDDSKDGGEMGAGHQVTAIYEIITTDESEGIDLKYQNKELSDKGKMGDEFCTVSIAYKDPNGRKSEYLEYPVGTELYTMRPSDDYRLAVAAAQASLAMKNSKYLKDIDNEEALISSLKIVRSVEDEYDNEYVSEFGDLLDILSCN